jgi:hypothetical protein
MSVVRLTPGRILLYQGRRLLVTSVSKSLSSATAQALSSATAQALSSATAQALSSATAQALSSATAQALDIDQRRYHLFLTPLGWAIDFQPEQLTIASLDWLPPEMVAAILGFLPLRERLLLQRLSKSVRRTVWLDPAIQRLVTLSPEQGLHQALAEDELRKRTGAEGTWEELLLWHERFPALALSEDDKRTSAGESFALFLEEEAIARKGDTMWDWDWLLQDSGDYTTPEVTRYLLRTHAYHLDDLYAAITESIGRNRLDLLRELLVYFGRRRPTDLYAATLRAARAAGQYNRPAILAWLLARSRVSLPPIFYSMFGGAILAKRRGLMRYLLVTYGSAPSLLGDVPLDAQDLPIADLRWVVELLVEAGPIYIPHALGRYMLCATQPRSTGTG